MKHKIIFMGFILVLFTAVYGFSIAGSAEDQTDRIDTSAFKNPHRPGAVFMHDEHNEKAEIEDCAVCHHVYDGKKLVKDESSEDSACSDCHSLSGNTENTIPLSVAFHSRCKTCHFERNKGPVLCGECHKKE